MNQEKTFLSNITDEEVKTYALTTKITCRAVKPIDIISVERRDKYADSDESAEIIVRYNIQYSDGTDGEALVLRPFEISYRGMNNVDKEHKDEAAWFNLLAKANGLRKINDKTYVEALKDKVNSDYESAKKSLDEKLAARLNLVPKA